MKEAIYRVLIEYGWDNSTWGSEGSQKRFPRSIQPVNQQIVTEYLFCGRYCGRFQECSRKKLDMVVVFKELTVYRRYGGLWNKKSISFLKGCTINKGECATTTIKKQIWPTRPKIFIICFFTEKVLLVLGLEQCLSSLATYSNHLGSLTNLQMHGPQVEILT